MSAPNAKFEVMENEGLHRNRHRKWLWFAIPALILALIALALGLGLGLGLKKGGSSPDIGPAPPIPTCTGNCTYNGTTLSVRTPWQIVLSETLTLDNQTSTTDKAATTTSPLVTPNPSSDPNVTLYDIDMFLHQNLTVVRDLRAQGMDVICYFSAGSYEPDRPDSWKFTDSDKGNELDGWPGEYWLDLNSDNVRQIMTARIEIAAQMNCTGIDPDNVDGYDNDNGLGLTQDDSISFMRFLAQEAAQRGLMTGLKNAGDIIDDVIDYVQFSVNEQCAQYDECDDFSAFPDAGKPVFHIEYPAGTDETDTKSFNTNTVSKYCNVDVTSGSDGFNTVLKYMNLSGWVQYCDERTYITNGLD
ncbi:hypothetical protein N0V82_004771 [Gnomoniopsis sp. IMI 355080]|nr:hypothetical protein N0V82_004771 [Gnomoniopsis sp. IMI 355080]